MSLSMKESYHKCWKKWVQTCNRQNDDSSKMEPEGKYVYQCSVHFITSLFESGFYKA